jgi:serine phosphatase RsbU (regulator of sigma subunit)
VLTRLNRMMCHLEPGGYATAIVAVWDEESGTLLRSNAGHPPVLRCRPGEFGFLRPPTGGRLLGVSPDWDYQEEPKVMRPGTTLLFYTDGLVEHRGEELRDGMRALSDFMEGLDDLSPQATCDQVIEWRRQQGHLEDDVCLLAARLK